MKLKLDIVILGLSITSSWGNGHATTYRSLVKGLSRNGHRITFLERDVPWYSSQRDLNESPFCDIFLYNSIEGLDGNFRKLVENADCVIVGSYVPNGVKVGQWVQQVSKGITAFYDIDTPVTLSKLEKGDYEYLSPDLIPGYDLYLSFTGGPILKHLEEKLGSPQALPLYCSFDPELYYQEHLCKDWDLGYLGTYSPDRQPGLENLLLNPSTSLPSKRFVVAGPQYPDSIKWPLNVKKIEHIAPELHRRFYNSQRYTLNLTRQDMKKSGYSPSVRLFEAAACATPIISDYWEGLETLFVPYKEIFIANNSHDVTAILCNISEAERLKIGKNACARVLKQHSANHRAIQLEEYILSALKERKSERKIKHKAT